MRFPAWMRGLALAAACSIPLACGAKAEKARETKNTADAEPEVKVEDLVVGSGPTVEKGDFVEVHYTGTLTDGSQFDTSLERQEPLDFRVGYGQMIKGFDKGVLGMKEGGRRRITVPPGLGYGVRGSGRVPPNAALIFDIEMMKVTK